MNMNEIKGVAKGVFPVNTGKVLIGRDYIPTKPHYATEAELFWQGVLLNRTQVRPSVSTSVKRILNLTRALRFWK